MCIDTVPSHTDQEYLFLNDDDQVERIEFFEEARAALQRAREIEDPFRPLKVYLAVEI